jgi:hypothetical protein
VAAARTMGCRAIWRRFEARACLIDFADGLPGELARSRKSMGSSGSPPDRAIEALVHPFTNLAAARGSGPLLIDHGHGVYVYDQAMVHRAWPRQ